MLAGCVPNAAGLHRRPARIAGEPRFDPQSDELAVRADDRREPAEHRVARAGDHECLRQRMRVVIVDELHRRRHERAGVAEVRADRRVVIVGEQTDAAARMRARDRIERRREVAAAIGAAGRKLDLPRCLQRRIIRHERHERARVLEQVHARARPRGREAVEVHRRAEAAGARAGHPYVRGAGKRVLQRLDERGRVGRAGVMHRAGAAVVHHVVAGVNVAGAVRHEHEVDRRERARRRAIDRQRGDVAAELRRIVRRRDVDRRVLGEARGRVPTRAAAFEVDEQVVAAARRVDAESGDAAVAARRAVDGDPRPLIRRCDRRAAIGRRRCVIAAARDERRQPDRRAHHRSHLTPRACRRARRSRPPAVFARSRARAARESSRRSTSRSAATSRPNPRSRGPL